MLLSLESYYVMKPLAGKVLEEEGSGNDSLIVEMHQTTTYKATQDSVPWCSSGRNWAHLVACAKRNPLRTVTMMMNKGINPLVIASIIRRAGFDLGDGLTNYDLLKKSTAKNLVDTKVDIVPPTFDAGAISWIRHGRSVLNEQWELGDTMVWLRDGGHHVNQFEAMYLNLFIRACGANQNNMVSSSTSYTKARLLDVRRDII